LRKRDGRKYAGALKRAFTRPYWAAAVALNMLLLHMVWTGQRFYVGDFLYAYHGVAYYITEVLGSLHIPEWIAVHKAGYPLSLMLQSGLWYPPIWVLAALGIPYTLKVASVLQAAHVAFGTLGAYVMLRRSSSCKQYAALGAFCYGTFGGFHTNSIHPDFIRAFALFPWLLALCTQRLAFQSSSKRRLEELGCVAVIFTFITGAYPGLIISGGACLAAFYTFQLIALASRKRVGNHLWNGFFLSAGALIAAVHLVPGALLSSFMVRSGVLPLEAYHSFYSSDLLSLFVTPTIIHHDGGHESTMTSLFMTGAIVAAFLFLPKAFNRRTMPWWGLLVFSSCMMLGPQSPVWIALTSLLPILKRSRFPVGEYRAFAVLACIALGTLQLQYARWTKWRPSRYVAVAFAGIPVACLYAILPQRNEQVSPDMPVFLAPAMEIGLASTAWMLAIGALYLLGHQRRTLGMVLLSLVALGDALRWSYASELFRPTGANWNAVRAESDAILARTHNTRFWNNATRPARTDSPAFGLDNWRGYLDGSFHVWEYSAPLIRSHDRCLQDDGCRAFMRSPWTAVVLPPGLAASAAFDPHQTAAPDTPVTVKQTSYAPERIVYQVRARRPFRMVENELYFPGWAGTIVKRGESPGGDAVIVAEPVSETFRSYELPAGNYTLVTTFRMPYLRRCLALSIVTAVLVCVLQLLRATAFWRRVTGKRST
jgi:hypothetical protein